MKNDGINVIELMFVGGRLNGERSRALPSSPEKNYYGDPAKHVKFERELTKGDAMEAERVKTKDAEAIMAREIENWMRWGRKKDWRPASYRCPHGFMFKSADPYGQRHIPLECNELEAVKLERIIVGLPTRHRQAFVMYHLERAAVDGRVWIKIGRNDAARLLGVQVRQYHYMVNQAHVMVLREYSKLSA